MESFILSKLCSLNLESRLNSSLTSLPDNKQTKKLFMGKLRKVFSIHLEGAVFLQRHRCESIEGVLKPDWIETGKVIWPLLWPETLDTITSTLTDSILPNISDFHECHRISRISILVSSTTQYNLRRFIPLSDNTSHVV